MKIFAPILLLWGYALLLCCSCNVNNNSKENTNTVVARAYSEKLYASDIKGIVPSGYSSADSEKVVLDYIDLWIKNRVLEKKAIENLTQQEKDIDKQLAEYKTSLLIYKYQSKLISEKLDTVVSEEQMKTYYTQNKNNFELKKNVVKLTFIKTDRNIAQLKLMRKLFLSSRVSDKTKLSAMCTRYANNFFLDDDVWLDFSEVLKELPIKTYDQEHFLKNNKFLEITEGSYIYFVNIKDYRIKNTISAFDYEKANIHEIILNKRKVDFLQKMESDLIRQAQLAKDIEKN